MVADRFVLFLLELYDVGLLRNIGGLGGCLRLLKFTFGYPDGDPVLQTFDFRQDFLLARFKLGSLEVVLGAHHEHRVLFVGDRVLRLFLDDLAIDLPNLGGFLEVTFLLRGRVELDDDIALLDRLTVGGQPDDLQIRCLRRRDGHGVETLDFSPCTDRLNELPALNPRRWDLSHRGRPKLQPRVGDGNQQDGYE